MLSDFIQRLLFVREFQLGNGSTEIIGTRQMIVPLDFMLSMQEADPDNFYRNMSSSMGRFFDTIGKVLGEDTFRKAEDLFNLLGLGRLKIVDYNPDEKKAFVEIHDTPIKVECGHRSHICSITTGVLAGIFSYLFKKEVHATVNKCMARGDEHCEFIIK